MGARTDLEGGRRSREEHLAAALELLDAHGTADPTLGMTMKGFAAAGGVTRSTLYRHWETVSDLNDDAARYAVWGIPGWPNRLLGRPADGPLKDAVEFAIGDARLPMLTAIRAGVATWPDTSAARQGIAAWELAAIDAVGWWLDAHARSHGRTWIDGASPRLAALAVFGCVEGAMLIAAYQGGMVVADWPADRLDLVAVGVEAVVMELTAPGEREPADHLHPCPTLPDAPPISATKAAIMERVSTAVLAAPFGQPESPTPGRIVDMARLARQLDVTERQLYRMWPSNEDFNTDVVIELARRLLRDSDRYTADALGIGLAATYSSFDQLLISVLQAHVAGAAHAPQANHFVGVIPMINPAIRIPVAELMAEWSRALRTTFVAIMAMAHRYRRAGITADRYTAVMMEGVLGCQRMATMNPSVAEETHRFRDADQPTLGLVLYFVGTSMSTTEPPHLRSEAEKAPAPPLPQP